MRVWALASCGGLLALTACSTDQSNTPLAEPVTPTGDGPTQTKSKPELPLTRSRVAPRPETRAARPLPSPSSETVSKSSPRSSQVLRARLEQIRAQRARVLPTSGAASISVPANVPTTGSVKVTGVPSPASPTPLTSQGANPEATALAPGANPAAQTLNRGLLPTSQSVITALPTPNRPSPASAALTSPGEATGAISAAQPPTSSLAAAPSGNLTQPLPLEQNSSPGTSRQSQGHISGGDRPTLAVPNSVGATSTAARPGSGSGLEPSLTHQTLTSARTSAPAEVVQPVSGEAIPDPAQPTLTFTTPETARVATPASTPAPRVASAPGHVTSARPGLAISSQPQPLSSNAPDQPQFSNGAHLEGASQHVSGALTASFPQQAGLLLSARQPTVAPASPQPGANAVRGLPQSLPLNQQPQVAQPPSPFRDNGTPAAVNNPGIDSSGVGRPAINSPEVPGAGGSSALSRDSATAPAVVPETSVPSSRPQAVEAQKLEFAETILRVPTPTRVVPLADRQIIGEQDVPNFSGTFTPHLGGQLQVQPSGAQPQLNPTSLRSGAADRAKAAAPAYCSRHGLVLTTLPASLKSTAASSSLARPEQPKATSLQAQLGAITRALDLQPDADCSPRPDSGPTPDQKTDNLKVDNLETNRGPDLTPERPGILHGSNP